MEEIRFTKDHYYIIVENDLATVGLTDFVLDKVIDEVSLIELPDLNTMYNKNDQIGVLVADEEELELFTPISGEIAEINENLVDEPDTIRNSTYENNWLFRVYLSDSGELEDTISQEEYNEYIENL